MKTKSPISIDSIRFFTYNHDMDDELAFIDQFPYDDRHDFAVDRSFGGLAVKAEVSNYRGDKGARREVSFTLIDVSSRCEVAVKKLKINLGKDAYKNVFLHFTAETSGLTGGCTYRLVICDETASTTLGEEIVHLFGQEMRRHPAEWYEVADCGVRPAWEDNLYKSLNTVDDHDYFVRFNLVQKLGTRLPLIMPELELRLHYPGGKIVRSFFKEPWCRGLEDFRGCFITNVKARVHCHESDFVME